MKAQNLLNSLGKDTEDDVPRKRRPKAPADTPAPDPTDMVAANATLLELASHEPSTPEATAAEQAAIAKAIAAREANQAARQPRMPEPVHKTSVDLRWSLKQALMVLCERDRRGPKAELNDALEAWLKAQGIDIPTWKG